ncbi:tonB-system energizer ExbB [Haematospirillum sp. 15-248]|uniref:tonB-system energizer ExbB n=1 Tax=Haematospirillum sp. 15-248 TaxID=2723107 RepID=UPI00143C2B14|nr:tonB-system energizer ExbB [Haematospirillum sp. 15-248]NKD86814.1 tonB-system energizer ExbB [Haematospirillum sp. 15-248]
MYKINAKVFSTDTIRLLTIPSAVALFCVFSLLSQASATDATEATTAAAEATGAVEAAISALPHDLSLGGMFMAADSVVKAVMGCLALASVMTWTIWGAKSLELRKAKRDLSRAIHVLDACRTTEEARTALRDYTGLCHTMIEAAIIEITLSGESGKDGIRDRTSSRLEQIEADAGRRMASGLGVLASIGSNSPFIGLFGTVWGIMDSFIGISKAQTTNLAIVAPGIAEALLATAMGLVAAIPAVILYNLLVRSIGAYRGLVGNMSATMLRLVSRELDLRSDSSPDVHQPRNHQSSPVRVAIPRSAAE